MKAKVVSFTVTVSPRAMRALVKLQTLAGCRTLEETLAKALAVLQSQERRKKAFYGRRA